MIFKYHNCELLRTNRNRNRNLRPGATIRERIVEAYRDFIKPDRSTYVTRNLFRSSYAVQQETRRHYRGKYWYIAHPGSRYVYYHSYFTFAFLLIDMIFKPCIAFFSGFKPSRHRPIRIISLVLDAIGLTWCASNFLCGYVSRSTGTVVLDVHAIAKRYARTYFFFDLIASLSLNVYALDEIHGRTSTSGGRDTDPTEEGMRHFGRTLCLIRVVRIITVVTRSADFFRMTNRVDYALLPFVVIVTAYQLHILTLFNYYVTHELYLYDAIGEESWVAAITNRGISAFHKYLTSQWVTARAFYRTGNQMTVEDEWEHGIYIAVMILGQINMLIITAILLRVFQLTGISEMKCQAMVKELTDYARHHRLPPRIKSKLLLFYERKFKGRYLAEDRIFESLTDTIRRQMIDYDCYKQTKEIAIFQRLPRRAVHELWSRTTNELFLDNDVVFQAGTALDAIYFVASGSLALFLENGIEYERHLHDGDIVGDMGYIHSKRTLYGAVAIEVTEMLRLPLRDLEQMFLISAEFKEVFLASAAWKLKRVNATDDFRIDAAEKPVLETLKLRK